MASDATLPSFFTAGPVTLNLWRAAQIVDRKIVRERDDYAYEAHVNELPSSPHETSACLATRKSTPRPKQKPHTRKATHIEAQTWGKTTKITKKGTPRQTISPWEKTARKAVVPLPGELVVAPSIPTIGYEEQDDVSVYDCAGDPIEDRVSPLPPSDTTSRRSNQLFNGFKLKPVVKTGNFDFARREHALPNFPPLPVSHFGDGFDKHELHTPVSMQKRVRKGATKTPSSVAPACLTLAPSMQASPSMRSMQKSDHDQTVRRHATASPTAMDTIHQSAHVRVWSNTCEKQSERHTSKLNEIHAQLLSLTAPARHYADSDLSDGSDDDEEPLGDDSPDPSLRRLRTTQRFSLSRQNALPTTNDHVLTDFDDMILDCADNRPSSGSVAVVSYQPLHIAEQDVIRPGHVARSLSTGLWNQTGEDIDDAASARMEPRGLQLRTISSNAAALTIASDRPSYFTTAEERLAMPQGRKHSIAPRRHSQAVGPVDDRDTEEYELLDHETRAVGHTPLATIRSRSIHQATEESTNRPPCDNLRTLVRRTSQDFGTISSYHRLPSISFKPPFLSSKTQA